MGRRPWSDRRTVEKCLALDITLFSRHGFFGGATSSGKPGSSYWGFRGGMIELKRHSGEVTKIINIRVTDDNYVRLFYPHTDNITQAETELDYKIQLVTTPCNLGGGVRYWFICPPMTDSIPCGRRVGKLYLPPSGKYFGCRHCYNLTYRSCKEHDTRIDALIKDPDRLIAQLKGSDLSHKLLALKACLKLKGII